MLIGDDQANEAFHAVVVALHQSVLVFAMGGDAFGVDIKNNVFHSRIKLTKPSCQVLWLAWYSRVSKSWSVWQWSRGVTLFLHEALSSSTAACNFFSCVTNLGCCFNVKIQMREPFFRLSHDPCIEFRTQLAFDKVGHRRNGSCFDFPSRSLTLSNDRHWSQMGRSAW